MVQQRWFPGYESLQHHNKHWIGHEVLFEAAAPALLWQRAARYDKRPHNSLNYLDRQFSLTLMVQSPSGCLFEAQQAVCAGPVVCSLTGAVTFLYTWQFILLICCSMRLGGRLT